MADFGRLRIDVVNALGAPVNNAICDISYLGDPENILTEVSTDTNGQSETVSLPAPDEELSQAPGAVSPYSNYTVTVRAGGFEAVTVNGINIFPNTKGIQRIILPSFSNTSTAEIINIGPNVLFGNYPPKIPEAEVKPMNNTGEIVLDSVVVPETIIVHDGAPSDSTATNYYVPFVDYITNVACSEIYPTWPVATITANVIAIISFTLNRVYTEWYRNKGYNFTITSSTAFDHKWIFERNIFQNVGMIVEEVFADYVSRPNIKQPILTQYCDGQRVTCRGMSQWGSKYLGDKGYTPVQILRNYYGEDVYINTAEQVSGVPASWPGYTLDIGSTGSPVRTIQEQLATIRETYSNIPGLEIDGIYGERTASAVSAFQSIFDLPVTGEVDFRTWYKISQLYVALERLAEL